MILERHPPYLSAEDYEAASDEIENALSSAQGVMAVYRTGSVSAYGISDLDRIAVVDEAAHAPSVWHRLSESSRAICMHSPFLVDAPTFARHRWFFPLEPLELVNGTRFEFEAEPAEVRAFAGVEGLVTTRLKLLKQLAMGRIKVRPFLCELHTLRHSLRLAGVSTSADAWNVAAETASLREDWWDLSAEKRDAKLLQLATGAPGAIDQAMASLTTDVTESRTASMKLGPPWANVLLTSADEPRLLTGATRVAGRLSRRAGEMAWRNQRRSLQVPPPALALLRAAATSPDPEYAERRHIVTRYAAFSRAQEPGWSLLGLATTFLQA